MAKLQEAGQGTAEEGTGQALQEEVDASTEEEGDAHTGLYLIRVESLTLKQVRRITLCASTA